MSSWSRGKLRLGGLNVYLKANGRDRRKIRGRGGSPRDGRKGTSDVMRRGLGK